MTRTIICASCQLPQILKERADDAPPGGVLRKVRGPLPLDSPAAADSTTLLWIDDDRLLLSLPALTLAGARSETAS